MQLSCQHGLDVSSLFFNIRLSVPFCLGRISSNKKIVIIEEKESMSSEFLNFVIFNIYYLMAIELILKMPLRNTIVPLLETVVPMDDNSRELLKRIFFQQPFFPGRF
jgi:hypothetical protein